MKKNLTDISSRPTYSVADLTPFERKLGEKGFSFRAYKNNLSAEEIAEIFCENNLQSLIDVTDAWQKLSIKLRGLENAWKQALSRLQEAGEGIFIWILAEKFRSYLTWMSTTAEGAEDTFQRIGRITIDASKMKETVVPAEKIRAVRGLLEQLRAENQLSVNRTQAITENEEILNDYISQNFQVLEYHAAKINSESRFKAFPHISVDIPMPKDHLHGILHGGLKLYLSQLAEQT